MAERKYRSSNNISRNFTEAEEAVDERTTEHLTTPVSSLPPALVSGGGTASQAYGWLKEDLANRDQATARLQNEMQLAGNQSIRRQLHEEAKLDTLQKEEATQGVSKLANWRADGFKSPEEAKQKLFEENPNYAMNPYVRESADYLTQNSKSDKRRELESMMESNAIIKT